MKEASLQGEGSTEICSAPAVTSMSDKLAPFTLTLTQIDEYILNLQYTLRNLNLVRVCDPYAMLVRFLLLSLSSVATRSVLNDLLP